MDNIFKLLAQNMIYPIWIKDSNLRYIFANKSYADLNDRTVDEIIGHTNEDIFEPSTCEIFTACSKEALETGKIVEGEMYTNKGYKYGTIVPLKNDKGSIIAIYGIFTDIGEIKEKEEEIEFQKNLTKQMIDILPGIIFFKDKDSKYVYANKECRDFYSARGVEEVIGKTDLDLNEDKRQVKKFLEEDKDIIENKITISNESIFRDKSGNKLFKETVKIPLVDTNGNVKGIIGRSLDITENKMIQKRLEYLSYIDILTGVNNRTCFEEKEKEFSKFKNMPLGVIMGDVNGLKILNDTFGHCEGDNLLKAVANVLKEVCEEIGEVFRIGGDEFVILIPNTTLKECERITSEIVKKCKEYKNDLFNISIALGATIMEDGNSGIYNAIKEAEDKVYTKKLLQNKSIKSSIINLLKVGLGVRSVETEQHTERVMVSAIKVGEKLGLEKSRIDELTIASELHDIGKIGINENILLKESALTEEEYSVMKTHSEKGYRIVMASSELKNVAEAVLYHHERWDGKGYPMGLKEEEIPLLARIINVCDSYDVMINERCYKSAKGKEEGISELRRCAGTQFDPEIVELFIELLE